MTLMILMTKSLISMTNSLRTMNPPHPVMMAMLRAMILMTKMMISLMKERMKSQSLLPDAQPKPLLSAGLLSDRPVKLLNSY